MSTSELKTIFGKVDADGNGLISRQEFKTLFKKEWEKIGTKLTDEQVEEAIKAMDKNKDGVFSIKEVIDWMVVAGYLPKTEGLGWMGNIHANGRAHTDANGNVVWTNVPGMDELLPSMI